MTFGATYGADGMTCVAPDGSTAFYLNFQIPAASEITFDQEDEGGKYHLYNVEWVNLELVDENMGHLIANTQNGWIKVYQPPVDEPPVVTYEYEYELNGKDMFYFSHDPRPFAQIYADAKINRRGVRSDGTFTEWKELTMKQITDFQLVTVEGGFTNPKDYFDAKNPDWSKGVVVEAYAKIPLMVNITDALPTGELVKTTLDESKGFTSNAIIGVKGDTDLNGLCNASDAAEVLIYAANVGAGEQAKINGNADAATLLGDEVAENFVFFLSDTDGESMTHGSDAEAGTNPLNASDAANQLIYAAAAGANGSANWVTDVMGVNNLPPVTQAIYNYERNGK